MAAPSSLTLELEELLQSEWTYEVYPSYYDQATCLQQNVSLSNRVNVPGALRRAARPPPAADAAALGRAGSCQHRRAEMHAGTAACTLPARASASADRGHAPPAPCLVCPCRQLQLLQRAAQVGPAAVPRRAARHVWLAVVAGSLMAWPPGAASRRAAVSPRAALRPAPPALSAAAPMPSCLPPWRCWWPACAWAGCSRSGC